MAGAVVPASARFSASAISATVIGAAYRPGRTAPPAPVRIRARCARVGRGTHAGRRPRTSVRAHARTASRASGRAPWQPCPREPTRRSGRSPSTSPSNPVYARQVADAGLDREHRHAAGQHRWRGSAHPGGQSPRSGGHGHHARLDALGGERAARRERQRHLEPVASSVAPAAHRCAPST